MRNIIIRKEEINFMGKKKGQPVDYFVVSDMVRNIIGERLKIKAKNEAQKNFIKLINEKEIIICSGPAGCGKSHISIAKAIELLQHTDNKYCRIVIYKPAIEVEEKHGFIPGTIEEKILPYIESSLNLIDKMVGKSTRTRLMDEGIIEIKALAYIRGANIDNAILIMEEAQNTSPNQMKTLLTRIGENSKFIISGDMDQSDRYSNVSESGLFDAMNRLRVVDEIGFFSFTIDDIVRNPIISKILGCYTKKSTPGISKPQLLCENNDRIIPNVPKIERSQLNEGVSKKTKAHDDSFLKKLKKYFQW